MTDSFSFSFGTTLRLSREVTDHFFALRCAPPEFPGQKIYNMEITIGPGARWTMQRDGFGNLVQTGCITRPHSLLYYAVSGLAEINPELSAPEEANPVFRFQSKCTAADEKVRDILCAGLPAAADEAANEIMNRVYNSMSYVPGSTDILTTASEAFSRGSGVCQDYAHVFLSAARSAGLCARYANGFRRDGTTTHAWCEVWLDGVWRGLDPTNNTPVNGEYVRLNTGRDFADCPIEKGVFHGFATQEQTISLHCSRPEENL